MSFKEIVGKMLYSFPIIFTYSILGAWTATWVLTGRLPYPSLVWEIFITTIPIVLARLVFYAKKELGMYQMVLRHGIYFLIIVTILLSASYFWEWHLHGSQLVQSIVLVVLVAIIYAIVLEMDFLRSKRLASTLMERIEEQR